MCKTFFFFKSCLFPAAKQVELLLCRFCKSSLQCSLHTDAATVEAGSFFVSPSCIFLSNFKPAFLNDNLLPVFPLRAHVGNMVFFAVTVQKSARPCFVASWTLGRSEAEIHRVCGARSTGGCESVLMWHWLRRRIKVSYFAATWPPLCASVRAWATTPHQLLYVWSWKCKLHWACTVPSGYLFYAWIRTAFYFYSIYIKPALPFSCLSLHNPILPIYSCPLHGMPPVEFTYIFPPRGHSRSTCRAKSSHGGPSQKPWRNKWIWPSRFLPQMSSVHISIRRRFTRNSGFLCE